MPVNDPVTAVPVTNSDATEDLLEAEYAALSLDQQASDRAYVMRGLACGDPPPTNPSPFLQHFLDVSEAERKAFLGRRAVETMRQAT